MTPSEKELALEFLISEAISHKAVFTEEFTGSFIHDLIDQILWDTNDQTKEFWTTTEPSDRLFRINQTLAKFEHLGILVSKIKRKSVVYKKILGKSFPENSIFNSLNATIQPEPENIFDPEKTIRKKDDNEEGDLVPA